MKVTLWESVEKAITIGSREQAERIIAGVEARASELYRDLDIGAALKALFGHAPSAKKSYEAATTFLRQHEEKMPKAKSQEPSFDLTAVAKRFAAPGGVGNADYMQSARAADDTRSRLDRIEQAMYEALAPVIKRLMQDDSMTIEQARLRSMACVPSAYSTLRGCQNAVTSTATARASIPRRIEKVAEISRALVAIVAKDFSGGTTEARLMKAAASFDWDDV